MIEDLTNLSCCGCSACVAACPKQCIKMVQDAEGFDVAVANADDCISCGLCEKVCPLIEPVEWNHTPKSAYAAYNKDEAICRASSSGGAFSMLAEQVIQAGGVVFGAVMDENLEVVIKGADSIEGLAVIRGSKYVEAKKGDSFTEAEKLLKEGRQVLFSGTPCMIAGLKKFLRRDYDNLLCVETACHGVPSPGVWKRYVDEKEKTCGDKLTAAHFREKYDGWKGYRLIFYTKDGALPSVSRGEEPFLRAFYSGISVRQSCFHCICKAHGSAADITLCDFWGVERIMPEFDRKDGVGVVLVQTEKGEEAFKNCGADRAAVDYTALVPYNQGLQPDRIRPNQREAFFTSFRQGDSSVSDLVTILLKPSMAERIKGKVSEVRDILSRIYHKVVPC